MLFPAEIVNDKVSEELATIFSDERVLGLIFVFLLELQANIKLRIRTVVIILFIF